MLAKHSESFSLVELPWKFPIAIAAILLLIYEGRFLDAASSACASRRSGLWYSRICVRRTSALVLTGKEEVIAIAEN